MLQLFFDAFPALSSPRLALRSMQPGDAPALFELRSNAEVMKHLGRPLATTLDDAVMLIQSNLDLFANNEGIAWAITLKDDDTLVGTIGFWRIVKEHYRTEIGYLLHPGLHGKGIMQEAIQLAVDFIFAHTELHSIEANVDPANIASRRVLEKCGFVQEAYFKENFFWNGQFLDSVIYSLVKGRS